MSNPGAIENLRAVFDTFDGDSDGTIDKNELALALERATCKRVSKRKLETLIKTIDTDKDGKVDFDEFCGYQSRVGDDEEKHSGIAFAGLNSVHDVVSAWLDLAADSLDSGSEFAPVVPRQLGGWNVIRNSLTAGALAAAISRTCTAPFDRWVSPQTKILREKLQDQDCTAN